MTVRVLIAEDSELMAEAIVDLLSEEPDFEVVGIARDGARAVDLAQRLKPDVITMDVRMPVLDGLRAIELIMSSVPTPILVMTADPGGDSGELALEALRRGALDLVTKDAVFPSSPGARRDLRRHLRLLAGTAVVRHRSPRQPRIPAPASRRPASVVGIVASTGGPAALARLLEGLPARFPCGILVVQHISTGFTVSLARWLDRAGPLRVRTARAGDLLAPGTVLLAPDDAHLALDPKGRVRLDTGPPVDGHRPSGTRLLESLAEVYGPAAAGVVLTGMGRDGARGLQAIRRAGGTTIAQDESTSAVYGMPSAARELGACEIVAPIGEIAKHLVAAAGAGRPGTP